MRNRIIALVSNNIATDQRLYKVGSTLQNNGYEFLLIGTNHRGQPDLGHIPFKTKRISLFFKKNIWFYTELQVRLFFKLLKEKKANSILLSNDLDTLLPAFLISKIYHLPLVYDSHEIFSELPTLKKGSFQKKVWKFLEKTLVPKVNSMYTVSKSYADFFEKEYGVKAKVVSNFPNKSKVDFERKELGENKSSKVLIYQGAINYSRGIDKMILAMQYLDNTELWIVGDGPKKAEYEKLSFDNKLTEKVKFLGRINPQKLKEITIQADLGLSLEEDNGLSYRYALPNKVFDYVHAEIPVLGTTDLPEVHNIIKKYEIGDVIENHNPKHITGKIENLLNRDKTEFKKGLKNAQKDLNWENHEAVLLSVYSEFN